MQLEELTRGAEISGVVPGQRVTVVGTEWHGPDALTLIYRDGNSQSGERLLYRRDEARLAAASDQGRRLFDASGADFRLAAEAQRIQLAGLFDPMLAVATSDVDPLPHQIRAVYEELLPRRPLRFLLADDPGAGKTIMAGLYIKELLLRGDLARCLVVAPGGLVEQWQDEMLTKFGLDFDILTPSVVENTVAGSVFERHPLLIARMDQLARNDDLIDGLEVSEWDLVVVDEAHRMSAHYFGNELKKTRRYELGELLGRIARHLLLMTATPHAGKEEDFQLFLALLDPDRFEGKYREGVHSADTTGLMRRMVKEDLLTFEGKPLFPERVAETVPYRLSALETELYDEVTRYVREEMNRADRLDKSRTNTVGFALTILQRRLASSPEAIYRSLQRRQDRLRRRRQEMLDTPTVDVVRSEAAISERAEQLDDVDELAAEQLEELEEEVVDAATAARTVAELDIELSVLADLERLAAHVRAQAEDRKWAELRSILLDRALIADRSGEPRKLIVFTEHRDTLAYLTERIANLLGRTDAVAAIHGGLRRAERRHITAEFTNNPHCQVLVATDAAGEGLNLHRAHLMVNYDLPWNPNRIEQRFGRIHRIGQREVCWLWNLVADGTREGEVFTRLLAKVEEQRQAYGGKVFDVLGEAFEGRPLRDLLVNAIRYGEQPEVRARLDTVIDGDVANGLQQLIEERALSGQVLAETDVNAMRQAMDEARARRLQPHYIEMFFRDAFARLGGRMSRREQGRWEISNVPARLRQRDPLVPARAPVATRYERVTFDPEHMHPAGQTNADLLAPGHPLLDVVVALTEHEHRDALTQGALLVDPGAQDDEPPRLLVAVIEEVVNGRGTSVAKRFGYTNVGPNAIVTDAGPAPYLDFVPLDSTALRAEVLQQPWTHGVAEQQAREWIIQHDLPRYGDEVSQRIVSDVVRTREAVTARLNQEINRMQSDAVAAQEKEAAGKQVRVRASTLMQRASDLEGRLADRLAELELDEQITLRPPRIVGAALVVPPSFAFRIDDVPPEVPPLHARETAEVERRAVDAVLAAERDLGRVPKEMPHNNPGYDVQSLGPDGHLVHIEVKGRVAGADEFFITYNEILHGKNQSSRYRLALVSISADGPHADELRYVGDPFARTELGTFAATGVTGNWRATWDQGRDAF